MSADSERVIDEIVHTLRLVKARVNVDEDAMSMLYEKIGMIPPAYPVELFSRRFKRLVFDYAMTFLGDRGLK